MDFELVLLWATIITGVVSLIDVIFFARRRKKKIAQTLLPADKQKIKPYFMVEYSRAFFPVLLIVIVLRSFVAEPFRIPSTSLEPTLKIGDFVLVNKFTYGLRLPVYRTEILGLGKPKRGDIIVFRWPPNEHYYFIKRIVGVPGDKVDYVDKTLTINGKTAFQTSEPTLPAEVVIKRENGDLAQVVEKQEDLLGVLHDIYQEPRKSGYNFQNINVPEGLYLVMGDNRDNSADSRYWGFVPESNIVGKAVFIWMSWDAD
ncbi:MAG TPA: signal peptidase I, partial [Gammaproteobacteria bacterium]|nr:signal peptidase I [Gammaproteobacteria bacterium]